MKKIFLTMVLVAGFAGFAFAEHPRAEHPSAAKAAEHPKADHPQAERPAAVKKASSPDQIAENLHSAGVISSEEVFLMNSSINLLLENGATSAETEKIVRQAVNDAKARGLTGNELAAKVTEAAQKHIASKKNPRSASEHPRAEHPGR